MKNNKIRLNSPREICQGDPAARKTSCNLTTRVMCYLILVTLCMSIVYAIEFRPRGNIAGSRAINNSNSTESYYNITGFDELRSNKLRTTTSEDNVSVIIAQATNNTYGTTYQFTNYGNQTTGVNFRIAQYGLSSLVDNLRLENYGNGSTLKIVPSGEGDGINIVSSAKDAYSLTIASVRESGEVMTIINNPASSSSAKNLYIANNALSTSPMVKMNDYGTGSALNINTYGNSLMLNLVGYGQTSSGLINVVAHNQTSGTVYQFQNLAAQTSGVMYRISQTNSSSTADVLVVENGGSGEGIFVNTDGEGYGIEIDSETNSKAGILINDMPSNKSIVMDSGDKICLNIGCNRYINYYGMTAPLAWSQLGSYPAACPGNSWISQLDDSVTCSAPTGITGQLNMTGCNQTFTNGILTSFVGCNSS